MTDVWVTSGRKYRANRQCTDTKHFRNKSGWLRPRLQLEEQCYVAFLLQTLCLLAVLKAALQRSFPTKPLKRPTPRNSFCVQAVKSSNTLWHFQWHSTRQSEFQIPFMYKLVAHFIQCVWRPLRDSYKRMYCLGLIQLLIWKRNAESAMRSTMGGWMRWNLWCRTVCKSEHDLCSYVPPPVCDLLPKTQHQRCTVCRVDKPVTRRIGTLPWHWHCVKIRRKNSRNQLTIFLAQQTKQREKILELFPFGKQFVVIEAAIVFCPELWKGMVGLQNVVSLMKTKPFILHCRLVDRVEVTLMWTHEYWETCSHLFGGHWQTDCTTKIWCGHKSQTPCTEISWLWIVGEKALL